MNWPALTPALTATSAKAIRFNRGSIRQHTWFAASANLTAGIVSFDDKVIKAEFCYTSRITQSLHANSGEPIARGSRR
jgi:hypothetical protein